MDEANIFSQYTWIFGINMLIRTGLRGWSSWIVYIIVGLMQVGLIGMGIKFKLRDREQQQKQNLPEDGKPTGILDTFKIPGWNRSSQSVASSSMPPDERRPLLAGHTLSGDSNGRATSGSRTRV